VYLVNNPEKKCFSIIKSRYLLSFTSLIIYFSILISFLAISLPCLGQSLNPGVYGPDDIIFTNPLAEFDIPLTYMNSVIYQDSKGFIWLGHRDGLYRYDGYTLKNFSKPAIRKDNLTSIYNATIIEDNSGYFWIGTYRKNGLLRYDPMQEKFIKYPRSGIDPPALGDAEIWAICPDSSGNVWIGTAEYSDSIYGNGRGLFKYSYETDSIVHFCHDPEDPNSLPSNHFVRSCFDNYGNLWFSSEKDLILVDPESDKFTPFRLFDEEGKHTRIFTTDIIEDSCGKLWLYNHFSMQDTKQNYLIRIDDRSDSLNVYQENGTGYFRNYEIFPVHDYVARMIFDKNGKLWLLTGYNGFIIFDPQNGGYDSLSPLTIEKENKELLPDDLSGLLCDASGSIWFGTGKGFQHYAPYKRKFTHHVPPEISSNLIIREYSSFFEDEDNILWIACDRGLLKYDPGSGEYRLFDLRPDVEINSIKNIRSVVPDRKGNLYCAGFNYLYIFNMEKETYTEIPYLSTEANPDSWIAVFDMVLDSQGTIWVGSNPGCIRVNPEKRTSEFVYGLTGNDSITGGITFAVEVDKRGKVWLGTELGLTRYNPDDKTYIPIRFDESRPSGLAAPQITAILNDHLGNMWIGYNANGFSFIDASFLTDDLNPDSLKFKHFTSEEGFRDMHVRSLVEDSSGCIWIATLQKLVKYNPKTGNFTSYDQSDGISIGRIDHHFSVNPLNGKIFIGGSEGFVSFKPDEIKNNPYIPPVVITDFRLNNKPVPISDTTALEKSITYTERIELSYTENFLEFEFSALDYTNPGKNMYKYMMKGLDPDTVYAGNRRTAEYRDMKPGEYTFWVTGSNNDGIWNRDGTSIDIIIRPPWYRSDMAFIGYGLLVLLTVSGYVRWRTASLKKDKEHLEEEVARRTNEIRKKNEQISEITRLKTKLFTDVSHEIRTPLSLISGPLENLLKNNTAGIQEQAWLGTIKRNSQRLLELVNQLLDISRLDSGTMKLVLDQSDIIGYLRMIINEYVSLAEYRNIRFISDIKGQAFITWYDRDKITKVITNLLSNAFKFTPKNGVVTCRIKISSRNNSSEQCLIRILVADTGSGIPVEEREKIFERFYRSGVDEYDSPGGTGVGLSLTRELVQLMKGHIQVRSLEGKGTVFIIDVPLGREHLDETEYIIKEKKEQTFQTDILKRKQPDAIQTIKVMEDGLKILVVEDNIELRTYISENLLEFFSVLEAHDGYSGLSIAREEMPDIIITDLMMPGMDGMEVCSKLKNDEKTNHIPVIILTARTLREDKIEGLESGADAYISKPFHMDELFAQIYNLVDMRERLRKRYSAVIGMDLKGITVNSQQDMFINKVYETILDHLGDFEFDVGELQKSLGISRGHLSRKLKFLTGESPGLLIRNIRLKAAAKIMETEKAGITDIAMRVGFSNPSYFARCFREYFGKTPREYRRSI